MLLKDRYNTILNWFRKEMPVAETELQYTNPYELLVAVILSAQCTDKRVNMVTPALFEAYPDAHAMAQATSEDIFPFIKSISYPNNKAKHLAGMAQMLVNDFNNIVPEAINDLIKMPGVGRKTANVIASVVYKQPHMAVDTHVYRVSRRIGLVPQTANTPLKVEQLLIKHIPQDEIHIAHHWLILHGRYTCLARTPKCVICGLQNACKYFEKNGLVSV